MSLAFAGAANHAPGITARRELASPTQQGRFFGAYAALRRRLEAARLDALVIVTAEHFTNFFMDNMPAFCIGLGERHRGPVEDEHFLKIPKTTVPGAADLARALAGRMQEEVDLSHSEELLFDHGLMIPLHLLTPGMDVPVIPIVQNCLAPPRPTLERCYRLGQALGGAIAARPERIGVLAAGGLSHWPAAPRSGEINEKWDREFLEAFLRGDRAALTRYSEADILRDGGPGGHEIRAWVTLAGSVEGRAREVLCFTPIPAYSVSGAVVSVTPA
jgi:2,3-dihydroxyphenylpropionate 1,2-dioxygenase